LRIGFLVAALLFGVLLFFCWVPNWARPDLRIVLIVVLSVAVLASVFTYWVVSFRTYTKDFEFPDEHSARPAIDEWTEQIALLTGNEANRGLTIQQVVLFMGCIVKPTGYFTRISEHIESFHRSTLVRSSFSIRPPSSIDKDIAPPDESTFDYLVPLLLPRKGTFMDGVRITDGADKRVTAVDLEALGVYSLAVIRRFLLASHATAFAGYQANGAALERKVWDLLMADAPTDEQVQAVTDQIMALSAIPQDSLVQSVADFIRELAHHRPICATVSSENVAKSKYPTTLRFNLERRIIGPLELIPGPFSGVRNSKFFDAIRLALGVRLNRVYFPLTAAYRTKSYHVIIEGPEGTYFAGEDFFKPALGPGEVFENAEITSQARLGQRRSHLQLRGLKGKSGAYYAVRFFERAPTSFSSITVAAVVSTALIGLLAFLNTSQLAPGAPDRLTSIIPALLALPIAVSAFVGLEPTSARRHPSLASRGVSFAIALLSICSFGLAVLDRSSIDIPELLWHLLLWLSIGTTLVSLASWVIRLSVEGHFARANRSVKNKE
jgi:hypothetical protein